MGHSVPPAGLLHLEGPPRSPDPLSSWPRVVVGGARDPKHQLDHLTLSTEAGTWES